MAIPDHTSTEIHLTANEKIVWRYFLALACQHPLVRPAELSRLSGITPNRVVKCLDAFVRKGLASLDEGWYFPKRAASSAIALEFKLVPALTADCKEIQAVRSATNRLGRICIELGALVGGTWS